MSVVGFLANAALAAANLALYADGGGAFLLAIGISNAFGALFFLGLLLMEQRA